MRDSPIGILDSGVGGLSIWQSIVALLPHESTLYVGDQAYAPYGAKSTKLIQQRVIAVIQYLQQQGCKLVVIACNAGTVAGIDLYRQKFLGLPIVGVVPVVKTAARVTKTQKFVVLSTVYTANSQYQKNLIKKFAGQCVVHNIGCPNFVTHIEQGITDGKHILTEMHAILDPVLPTGIDVIALGCTHYPFLRPVIASIARHVDILDSGDAVARHVSRVLTNNNTLSERQACTYSFLTTGESSHVSGVASRLLGKDIYFNHVQI